MTVTAERVRELLDFDPATGVFRHRTSRGGMAAGSIAGSINTGGYWQISIDGRNCYGHQLAWLYVHGEWVDELDHRDTVRHHNRIENLRPATRSQNNANASRRKDNTSGFKGVSFYKSVGRFTAEISKDRKRHFLGYFDTPEDAHRAYATAAVSLYGEFARAANAAPVSPDNK